VSLQANLREKTKQMKAMASELNMYQAQVIIYSIPLEACLHHDNIVYVMDCCVYRLSSIYFMLLLKILTKSQCKGSRRDPEEFCCGASFQTRLNGLTCV